MVRQDPSTAKNNEDMKQRIMDMQSNQLKVEDGHESEGSHSHSIMCICVCIYIYIVGHIWLYNYIAQHAVEWTGPPSPSSSRSITPTLGMPRDAWGITILSPTPTWKNQKLDRFGFEIGWCSDVLLIWRYPLVIKRSYWKWPSILSFPSKHCVMSHSYVELPEVTSH